jgi:hypothetical protein
MKCNVGGTDRVLRITAGVLLLIAGVALKSAWGLIGLVPLLTGLFRFCPLYPALKINTSKKRK